MRIRGFILTVAVTLIAISLACSGSNSQPPPSASESETPTAIRKATAPATTPPTSATATAVPTIVASAPTNTPTRSTDEATASILPLRDNETLTFKILSHIPDNAQTRSWFVYNDYELARSLFGINRPDPLDDEAGLEYESTLDQAAVIQGAFLGTTGYLDSFADTVQSRSARQKARNYIGFGQSEIDQSIYSFGTGDDLFEIVFGEIRREETRHLLDTCQECRRYEIGSAGKHDYYFWDGEGERDFRNQYTPPLFDGSGFGGRFGVADDVAWRTLLSPVMEKLLETEAGDQTSLAEDTSYLTIFRTLVDANAYWIRLSAVGVGKDNPNEFTAAHIPDAGFGVPADLWFRLQERLLRDIYPLKFNVYGVGAGWDEIGFYSVVAYAYPDSVTAQESLPRIKARFETAISLSQDSRFLDEFSSMEFKTEGTVALAILRRDSDGKLTTDSLAFEEPMFLHE